MAALHLLHTSQILAIFALGKGQFHEFINIFINF